MTTPNEATMLAIMARELAAGRPGPTNDQFCAMLGYQSWASAARLVAGLVTRGLITVEYPNRCRRVIQITGQGMALLDRRPVAAGPTLPIVPPKRDVQKDFQRRASAGRIKDRAVDVSALPPVGDTEERLARSAAIASNAVFLKALARVARPPEPPVKPEGRFTALPPPSLTGQAYS